MLVILCSWKLNFNLAPVAPNFGVFLVRLLLTHRLPVRQLFLHFKLLIASHQRFRGGSGGQSSQF